MKTVYTVGERVRIIGYSSKLPGYNDRRNPVGLVGTVIAVNEEWGTPDNPAYVVQTDKGRYPLVASEIEAQP